LDSRLLLLEDDWVRLNPKADLWLDVAVFERAFVLAQGVPGQALDDRRAQVLHTGVYFYQSDLANLRHPKSTDLYDSRF
jgi:hypothetical protein